MKGRGPFDGVNSFCKSLSVDLDEGAFSGGSGEEKNWVLSLAWCWEFSNSFDSRGHIKISCNGSSNGLEPFYGTHASRQRQQVLVEVAKISCTLGMYRGKMVFSRMQSCTVPVGYCSERLCSRCIFRC